VDSKIFRIQRAATRHFSSHGWLQTFFSFSFADYYDSANLNWGALRVLNDDTIAAHSGFETHPHRDMEIITYVLSGELEHQDSFGHRGVVKSGGVQYMSAGTGILHSEKNAADVPLHLLQMWVVPRKTGLAPNYGQLDLTENDRKGKLVLVATGEKEKTFRNEKTKNVTNPNPAASVPSTSPFEPISIHQDASFYIGRLENKPLIHMFSNPDRLGFLFVASGTVTAKPDGVGHALKTGDAVRMAGIEKLELDGNGEVVLWDLPEVDLV